MRDSLKLLGIVGAGCLARGLALGIGRDDFGGWFNHRYYYFVQTRSLLERGSLAYPDMPALFHLYSWLAGCLVKLGLAENDAIVMASRLVMSIVPSLIALPLYGIVRGLNEGRPLRPTQWVLVAMGGFLPLSVSYLPDVQQKNALGLLLLMTLLHVSRNLLVAPGMRSTMSTALVAVLIVLSHFGTVAAMVLFGVAVAVAYAVVHRFSSRSLRPVLALGVAIAAAAGSVRSLDPQRFRRVLVYARDSVGDSLIAGVWGGQARPGALASLAVVALFYTGLVLLFLGYRRRRTEVGEGGRVFWLANLLFCALLLLPALDEHLMGRLGGFLPVPLIVLLAHLERFVLQRAVWRRVIIGAAALVLTLLAVGELVSARVHAAHNRFIARDLRRLGEADLFGERDLVITRTGAEHVCNWYFNVAAGVVTSLTLDDFERYRTIWVLNPSDGDGSTDVLHGRVADSEDARYRFMLDNVLLPEELAPAFTSESLEVFALAEPPESWVFTPDGRWNGYRALSPSG